MNLSVQAYSTAQYGEVYMTEQEGEAERVHGFCADKLMEEYGVDSSRRREICEEIATIWREASLIEPLIILSVLGWVPEDATKDLEQLLQTYQTHEPINCRPRQ